MLNPPSVTLRESYTASAPKTLHGVLGGALRYWRAGAAIFGLVVLIGLVAALLVPPSYRAQARLLVLTAGVYDMQAENGAQNPAQALNPTDVVNVEIQLLQSAELHRAVARRLLGVGADPQSVTRSAARLESALHITKVTDANVIELSYADRDPDRAATVLRALLDAYFVARAEVLTSGRLGFLSGQLADVQVKLDAVDRQILTVQRGNNVVDIAAQIAGAVQQTNDLARARMESEATLADGRRNIDTLRRGARSIPQQVELYNDNSEAARSLGEMQTSLLQLRARRADFASRYMAGSPQVQQLDKQIAGLQTAITRQRHDLVTTRRVGRNEFFDTARDRLTQAEAAAAGGAARRSVLAAQEQAARARMSQLIGVSDTLARLRLRRDILADSVRSIAARVEQARIQRSQAASAGGTNVRVVEAPTPPDRRNNPPVLFIAAALVCGLALAGIAVLLLASVRRTYLFPEEAAAGLDLPALPAADGEPNARRAFDELASAVAGIGGGATALLLAPTSRQDVQQAAIGLGAALDRRSRGRVLLIRFADAARVPADWTQADVRIWNGIATTVIGTDACVQRGVASALLAGLRTRFDYVVVTAPPTSASADGVALAALMDAVILVVRADETPAAHARALVTSVRERGVDPLGVVLVGTRRYGPDWLARMLGAPAA